jgi:hypothetical protein
MSRFVEWMAVCVVGFSSPTSVCFCLFAYGFDLRLGGRRLVAVLMWFNFKTRKGQLISKTCKGIVFFTQKSPCLKPVVLVT